MLRGRGALVTGSTSGIGLGIARALAAQGCGVVLNGFGEAAEVERLRAGLAEAFGVPVFYCGADVSRAGECAALIAEAEDRLGSVDILVNNAGIQHVAPIESFPAERWDAILAVNLSSAFHTIRLAVPGMRSRLGPPDQCRLGARAGGFTLQGGLLRGQARHRGPHQGGGAGNR